MEINNDKLQEDINKARSMNLVPLALTDAVPEWERNLWLEKNGRHYFADKLITDQRREDMIVGALEGGSNYWYWIPRKNGTNIIDKYRQAGTTPLSIGFWEAVKAGETIEIQDKEDRGIKIGEINLNSIMKGEMLMLKEQPEHFKDIITEADDATTADVWFQFCCLGEIVYG